MTTAQPDPTNTNQPKTLVQMTHDEFVDKFKPVKNHFDIAAWGGVMFETYGEEFDHVLAVHAQDPNKVWTIIEVDGDEDDLDEDDEPRSNSVLVSGLHYVNRIGYVVTEVPAEANMQYEVRDED